MHKISVIQMSSCSAIGMNLVATRRHILEACLHGAQVIILPDCFALFSKNSQDYNINKEILGEGRIQNYLQKLSQENSVWIIASGIPIISEYNQEKFCLATVACDDQGKLIDVYYHLTSAAPHTHNCHLDITKQQESGQQTKLINTPLVALA